MQYTGLKSVLDYASRINGSYSSYKADIRYIYKVEKTAWYNVMIQVCYREDIYGYVTGTVTFHNPYGYLEAKDYWMLPVEVNSASYPPPRATPIPMPPHSHTSYHRFNNSSWSWSLRCTGYPCARFPSLCSSLPLPLPEAHGTIPNCPCALDRITTINPTPHWSEPHSHQPLTPLPSPPCTDRKALSLYTTLC